MMWLVKIFQKRPSDKTIKIGKILFWLLLVWSLYYNLIYQAEINTLETNFFWMDVSESTIKYITYAFIAMWIIPVYTAVTNVCLLKKKYMRYVQVFFWITILYASGKVVETASLDIDSLLLLMWLLPLAAWITWKCITSNCMKYKEKITKIRV